MAELTPMKRQYQEIKAQNQDCILFFRLGDFYEMFDDDARLASKELDLALTTRDRGIEDPDERTPMCGVPYHSCEGYISRLVAKGYKVAICEQMEDPALAKGLVERQVIRVITPGTITYDAILQESQSNYICSVWLDSRTASVCFADITTGEVCLAAFEMDRLSHLRNELARFHPAEAVLCAGAQENAELLQFLRDTLSCSVQCCASAFEFMPCAARVCEQYGAYSVDELPFGDNEALVLAVGGLLSYLADAKMTDLRTLRQPEIFTADRYMELDVATRRNLELTETLRGGERRGSLLWVLDQTNTPMGSRMLRSWVERPLLSPVSINRRLLAVEELFEALVLRSELRGTLREIGDMERLVSKAVYGTANGRDLLALGHAAEKLPELTALLKDAKCAALRSIAGMDTLEDLTQLIRNAICEEPPFSLREGNVLRSGYNEEVDRLRSLRDGGADAIAALEAREREATGIKKLKVGYNKVFGYFIDVPRSAAEQVPERYIRKQTLVSNERYFTSELKELESSLLTARDRLNDLEYELFCSVRTQVAEAVSRVQAAADAVAQLDAFCSLAEVASRYSYVKPTVDNSEELYIKDGRHPVVERTLRDVLFVPNDTHLNRISHRTAIITGPNMAGKSTYMRQTALITIMAQMGSFVPARVASIGVVDRVFTRIGASDDLAAGQSTFMVEMSEVSVILSQATKNSLIILDEVGRGTSTYDGMAIARAVLEYCNDPRYLGAKTMFATHYHELTALSESIGGITNYNISAKKQGDTLIFLRKIVAGAADESYGIEVASLAGVPERVISRAKACLKELEGGAAPVQPKKKAPAAEEGQISFANYGEHEVLERLKTVSLDTLTPIEAMNFLYELKKKVESE